MGQTVSRNKWQVSILLVCTPWPRETSHHAARAHLEVISVNSCFRRELGFEGISITNESGLPEAPGFLHHGQGLNSSDGLVRIAYARRIGLVPTGTSVTSLIFDSLGKIATFPENSWVPSRVAASDKQKNVVVSYCLSLNLKL
jgi:hypothetical protein